MGDDNQITKREALLEGLNQMVSGVYNKIQSFQETEIDEDEEFIKIIKKAREEWQRAEKTFQNVLDPDLIDYAIYNVEATKARYTYLLKRAKEMGIKTKLY